MGLSVDAREVRHSFEDLAEGRDIISREDTGAWVGFLHGVEVIPSRSGDEQGSGWAGITLAAEVFYKVKELASLAADTGEKLDITRGVVGREIVISVLVS